MLTHNLFRNKHEHFCEMVGIHTIWLNLLIDTLFVGHNTLECQYQPKVL